MIAQERCLALRGCRSWSAREPTVPSSMICSRSSTRLWGRAGSRRTTSPSLRYNVSRRETNFGGSFLPEQLGEQVVRLEPHLQSPTRAGRPRFSRLFGRSRLRCEPAHRFPGPPREIRRAVGEQLARRWGHLYSTKFEACKGRRGGNHQHHRYDHRYHNHPAKALQYATSLPTLASWRSILRPQTSRDTKVALLSRTSSVYLGHPPRPGSGSCVAQVLVDHLYGDGALAHGRRDPLDRAVPDVTHHEHPRYAALQQHRQALEGPPLRRAPVAQEILPGNHEALLVAQDVLRQPLRMGLGAY